MSAYPEPPAENLDSDTKSSGNSDNQDVDGITPGRFWPWGIALLVTVGLAMQTQSLLRLMSFEQQQADFDAKAREWDNSNASRQKAFDQWLKLEDEARVRIEGTRSRENQLRGVTETLESQHDELVQSIASQSAQLSNLQSKEADLETRIKEKEKTLVDYATKIETHKERIASLAEQQDEAKSETEELLVLGRRIQTEIAKLETQKQNEEKILHSQSLSLTKTETRRKDAETQCSELETRIAEYVKTLADQQAEKIRAEQVIQASETAIEERDKAEEGLLTLQTEIQAAQNEVKNRQGKVNELDKEIANKQTTLAGLDQEHTKRSAQLATLQGKLEIFENVEEQLAKAEALLEKTEGELATSKNQKKLVQEDLASGKIDLEDLKGQTKKEKDSLEELRSQLTETEKRLVSARSQEQAAAARLLEATRAVSDSSKDAAASLTDLSSEAIKTIRAMREKAVEVRQSIEEMAIPERVDPPQRGLSVEAGTTDGKAVEDSETEPSEDDVENNQEDEEGDA